jgi:hypothetical protein
VDPFTDFGPKSRDDCVTAFDAEQVGNVLIPPNTLHKVGEKCKSLITIQSSCVSFHQSIVTHQGQGSLQDQWWQSAPRPQSRAPKTRSGPKVTAPTFTNDQTTKTTPITFVANDTGSIDRLSKTISFSKKNLVFVQTSM